MLVPSDKSQMTIERLAIETGFLCDNLKWNMCELKKRKDELKKLDEIYDLELLLRKSRKKFGFQIMKIDENFSEMDVFYFIKNYVISPTNDIKEYNKIYDFVYIKLKYNEIIENKEWTTPTFQIRQMNPKFILKKSGSSYIEKIKYVNLDENNNYIK